MKYFCEVDASGNITRFGPFEPEAVGSYQPSATAIISDEPISIHHFIKNGQLCLKPEKPDGFYVFDEAANAWVADIASATVAANAHRVRLLKESDWTQMPDVPLASKEAWLSYRQALRDITEQEGYPMNVIWPSEP